MEAQDFIKQAKKAAEQVRREARKETTALLCRVRLHRWSKWETVGRGRYSDTNRRFVEQRRHCIACGEAEWRDVND